MKVGEEDFLLASKKDFSLWNLESEKKTKLTLEGCHPNLVELMENRYLLVADKWIRCYDL